MLNIVQIAADLANLEAGLLLFSKNEPIPSEKKCGHKKHYSYFHLTRVRH
jgi:hypothetical protein